MTNLEDAEELALRGDPGGVRACVGALRSYRRMLDVFLPGPNDPPQPGNFDHHFLKKRWASIEDCES